MSTESDRSSENRHQDPGSAEEPQHAGTSGRACPDQVVPPWSVPPGLIAPHAAHPDAERLHVTPAEAEPSSGDDDLPGVSPPAGWFLRSPASSQADSPQTAAAEEDPETDVTGEWFAAPAPAPGESPISWYEGLDDPEPPAPASERPVQPAASSASNATAADPAGSENPADPAGPGPSRRPIRAVEPVVSPTRALRGRPGGPGLPPLRPGPGSRRAPVGLSPWQTSQRLWNESEIPWDRQDRQYHQDQQDGPDRQDEQDRQDQHPAAAGHQPPQQAWPPRSARPPQQAPPLIPPPRSPNWSPQRQPAGRHVRPDSLPPEPSNGAWPGNMRVPLSAPVFAEPRPGARPAARSGVSPAVRPEPRDEAWPEMRTAPSTEPHASVLTEPRDERDEQYERDEQQDRAGYDTWRAPRDAPPLWADGEEGPPRSGGIETLLLGPELPGTWRPRTRRGRVSRRTATIVVPVIVLIAVAVLALALLTGHGPKLGQLSSSQQPDQVPNQGTAPQSALTIAMYPGQQQRGVFQTINRIVASGNTIVTMGSQTSDGVVRQQFFVSANGGASWHLAPVYAAGGQKVQAPLGYPAARLAGGPGGWLAVGPQAIWTSPNGQAWTLASTKGITPMLTGDAMWVLNSTSGGFLAAGVAADGNHATQAVIWTSRDGVTWQRKTAAQLGLAGPGETVQDISYITAHGTATVMSGQVTRDGATYAGVWLSTDGCSGRSPVTVPADHGAGAAITGLGSDGSGLLAVRPARSADGAPDGVAYFSPNGTAWQYAGTIGASAGWDPGLVKGSNFGFVVAGASVAGQLVAFTSTGAGGTWQQTGSLGNADTQSVVGATVASAGTIVAVGYTSPSKVSQQPVFLMANAAGSVRPVSLAGLAGGAIPELSVNGLAVAGGQQIAVGSTEGYPAVWRKASGGSWTLATSLSQVSG